MSPLFSYQAAADLAVVVMMAAVAVAVVAGVTLGIIVGVIELKRSYFS